MKTSSKILLVILAVLVALAIVYRAVNVAPDANLATDRQMMEIMADGGCAECHTANPEMPFYANWPIAKSVITEDIVEGYKSFDIEPMLSAMANGEAINEVDLAKVEKTIVDGTMPLAKYYLVHWGASFTGTKELMALNFIKEHRAAFYPNMLAAAEFANEAIRPVPDRVEHDADKAALGKLLYHDTRLSGDGTVSCASCHDISTGGVDNLMFSKGIYNQLGGINAPTVYNATFNFVQFWDGRAATLEEQAAGPPLNPVEMGSASFDEIVARLSADAEFVDAFNRVYPEGLSEKTITNAIAEYERTLVTPNCAFDRYLKGEKDAITADEIEGYELFKQYNCATCHAGVNMGGLSYELMGQRANYFADREINNQSGLTDSDNGRWAQTHNERDRYRFRTPGLRNVALTFPYYHDGSVETLEEAVDMMATYQVGKKLNTNKINKISLFLNTLTGEYNGEKLTNANVVTISSQEQEL